MNIKNIDKIDVTVFDKVNITMRGAELKQLLGEWFVEIMKDFQESLNAQCKEKKYLTAEEIAQMLGVDKSTLWRWDKCGYLPKVKVGSKVRYRESDVRNLMERR